MPEPEPKSEMYEPEPKFTAEHTYGNRILIVCPYPTISGFIHAALQKQMPTAFYDILSQTPIWSDGAPLKDQLAYVHEREANKEPPFLIIDFQRTRNIVKKQIRGETRTSELDIIGFKGYQLWVAGKQDITYLALKDEIFSKHLQPHHVYSLDGSILLKDFGMGSLPQADLEKDLEKLLKEDTNWFWLFTGKP